MLVIRVLVKVKPEEKTGFINHMKHEMAEVKEMFAGCEKFNLYGDIARENTFMLYEEWQSQVNFDAYKNSDYFKKNGEKLFAMMAEPPDSAYFKAEVLQ